jgi:serine palmitoyltransferase
MGTFTKSFSGMGGYMAASKEIIDHVKRTSPGIVSHNSMSPVICQQVITAFKIIMGEDGTNIGKTKLDALRNNSNFFRAEMKRIGLHVYGDVDSPIIPVMIYFPTKVAAFSRECLKRGLAVVVVGFPATSVILSRARFCVSAGHTHEDLVKAIKIIDEVADLLLLKYNNNFIGAGN